MKAESGIVLNGSYHNSLTIVRSLARKNIPVIVGDESRGIKSYFGEGMLSRYVSHRFLYPSPEKSPSEFIEKINKISRKYGARVLFPVGSDTYITISAYREQLSKDIKMALADDAIIQKAHDKYRCLRYAESIGIPFPKFVLLKNVTDFEELNEFGLPLIVKPRKGAGNFGVKILNSLEEVIKIKRSVPFRRYKRKTAHKKDLKQFKWYAGRYPSKAAARIYEILTAVESNAEYKGLDVDLCRIIHAAAQRGRIIKRYIERAHGRSTASYKHLSHVEIVIYEFPG